MQHWNIHVRGKVQGVGYRYFVERTALALGLTGFVRNEPDGSVYIETEGEASVLEALVEKCSQGPSQAQVVDIEIAIGSLQYFESFEIKR